MSLTRRYSNSDCPSVSLFRLLCKSARLCSVTIVAFARKCFVVDRRRTFPASGTHSALVLLLETVRTLLFSTVREIVHTYSVFSGST